MWRSCIDDASRSVFRKARYLEIKECCYAFCFVFSSLSWPGITSSETARQRDSETEKNGSELGRKRSDCWAIHKQ